MRIVSATNFSHVKIPISAGICSKAFIFATHAVGQDVSQLPRIVTANVHHRCMSTGPVMIRLAVRAADVFATKNGDMRCAYYERKRHELMWAASDADLGDTVPGTGGSAPHRTQVDWDDLPTVATDSMFDQNSAPHMDCHKIPRKNSKDPNEVQVRPGASET